MEEADLLVLPDANGFDAILARPFRPVSAIGLPLDGVEEVLDLALAVELVDGVAKVEGQEALGCRASSQARRCVCIDIGISG